MCIAKCLLSYRDDLSQDLSKTTLLPKNNKKVHFRLTSLPVDVRRSKTPLLKVPDNTPGFLFRRHTVLSKKEVSESVCSPTFLFTSGVENVYNIGLRAEFTGRTNTAIHT